MHACSALFITHVYTHTCNLLSLHLHKKIRRVFLIPSCLNKRFCGALHLEHSVPQAWPQAGPLILSQLILDLFSKRLRFLARVSCAVNPVQPM